MFYTNGELSDDVVNGEIHVHPLSAIGEINLKSADQLFSGKAIDFAIRECVPSVKKPLDLLAKDLDAILCFIKVVSYGPMLETYAYNQGKENSEPFPIDVNIETLITESVHMSDEIKEKYQVRLDNGQLVNLRPITYNHVLNLLQAPDNETDGEALKRLLLENMTNSIVDVDGIVDRGNIMEWLRALPARYMNDITKALESVNETWGISLKQTVRDPKTNEVFDTHIEIDPTVFFSS